MTTATSNASTAASTPPHERPRPMLIAPNTWLVREYVDTGPVGLYANSMVIDGEQPIIIDTGRDENEHWDEDVFSLVRPQDVRWIYISRLSRGCRDRLAALAVACPNATLVCSDSLAERIRALNVVAASRIRVIGAGQELQIGDRPLAVIRLPVSYMRNTLGLLDKTTNVLWAADSFGVALLEPTERVSELHAAEWREGFELYHRLTAPWLLNVAEAGFHREVHELHGVNVRIIAGAHTPPIGGYNVGSAIDMLYDLTQRRCSSFPGQTHLEALLACLHRSEHDPMPGAFARSAA